jgi:hypothetical protein
MHPGLFFLAISASQALAQMPCGFKIAPCPADQVCMRRDPSCTRGENCAGFCTPKSDYDDVIPAMPSRDPSVSTTPRPNRRGCGVRTTSGVYNCEADEKCIDDPIRQGSCGMACDLPGICVKKSTSPVTVSQPKPTFVICGGRRKEQPCKKDEKCVDKPETPGALAYDGAGICVKISAIDIPPTAAPTYERKCGGMTPQGKDGGCLKDEICMDDPRRPEGAPGLALDGPGICVK